MLIIYSGHEIRLNAWDLCVQTRFRSQEKWEGKKKVVEIGEMGGGGGQELWVHYPVVEYFLINTWFCLQTQDLIKWWRRELD